MALPFHEEEQFVRIPLCTVDSRPKTTFAFQGIPILGDCGFDTLEILDPDPHGQQNGHLCLLSHGLLQLICRPALDTPGARFEDRRMPWGHVMRVSRVERLLVVSKAVTQPAPDDTAPVGILAAVAKGGFA